MPTHSRNPAENPNQTAAVGDAVNPSPSASDELPVAVARQVNAACEQFEAAWRSGARPRVEEFIAGWTEGARRALLVELIALDLELRRGVADSPAAAEYRARFPDDSRAVELAFGSPETTDDASVRRHDPDATIAYTSEPAAATSAPPADHVFGDFELIEEIARGGMGVVYRARQRSLNRLVALKMILSGPYASPEETRRFRLEAELAANLDHPNIVPIYEVGEHEGRVFFTMKLVDGGSLTRELSRMVADPRAAARLLATVARAVHYAHRRGFVHCDLKPANILLDAEGVPHVTDFGLARRVDGESTLTASGALMGTPSYMAPEQASGQRQAVTAAADVYGLGAVFYELLTGHPPFRAPTVMETVVRVLEREPRPPSELRSGVPRELESVCLKCLEKSPRDRFVSAAELAESIDQYLRGDSVAGTTVYQRLRRWTRREPELVAHIGALAVVAVLTQYNYYHSTTPNFRLHYGVQALLGLWALASILYEFLMRRGVWAERVRYAWAATDALALTCLLFVLNAFNTDLIVAYPLLIAASGLWFRVRLVWFTTALAVGCYGLLYLLDRAHAASGTRHHYANIFLAALLVTGFVVARQVKRIWALSAYYENRPAD
jgi:serine/threonine-protein kinase